MLDRKGMKAALPGVAAAMIVLVVACRGAERPERIRDMATVASKDAVNEIDERTKPPFLRRVRVRGYKSIGFCDVGLQPLTILVGRNAAGKSNFLDALAFLRDILIVGVNEASNRHGGYEAIPCRSCPEGSARIEIECGYTVSGDAVPWAGIYSIEIAFPKKRPAEIRHEHLRLLNGKWWIGYTNNNGQVTCSAADDGPAERDWKITDRPFLDNYHDTPVPEFHESLAGIATYNFHPDTIRSVQKPLLGVMLERDGRNLASAIGSLKEIKPDFVQRVRDYLSIIAEEVESFDVVRYGEYETIRFRLRRDGKGPMLEFDAASMSDGSLRALAALVAAFQIHLPTGPTVVGIEEPETALHPAAMRALVDALDDATQRTQVLLTTHSADLLSSRDVSPGQVLVVRNRGGQTHITPVDPASREIIEKELYSLAELQRMDKLDLDEADLNRQAQLSRQGEV
jgi:predicted ATPase